jgi:hypothetical protein
MTTKVQTIFDQAIHLMDEQNEGSGATNTADTVEYKVRTISILNTAIPRLYPFSSNYDDEAAGRPKSQPLKCEDYANPDFTQIIQLDDDLCIALLPFYLAAHLLAGENDELSQWFMSQYREAYNTISGKNPAEFKPIPTPYGLF